MSIHEAHLVLHGVAVKKHTDACAVARLVGLDDARVAELLTATMASYHTVWFELHEDILRVLGRERAE